MTDIPKDIPVVEESVYTVMCGLAVNEKLIVCLPMWNAVRRYAQFFKTRMGRKYTVHRMHTKQQKLDYLLVQRTE